MKCPANVLVFACRGGGDIQALQLLFCMCRCGKACVSPLMWDLQVEQRQWHTVAALRHHATPVLCTASLAVGAPPAAHGTRPRPPAPALLVFSGATDGGIAVWDLSLNAHLHAAGSGSETIGRGPDRRGGGAPPQALAPVCTLDGLHQSGVNAMSAAAADGARAGGAGVVLVTGGDDQAIGVVRLGVR